MRVREWTAADTAPWTQFVERSASATLFHALPWREVVARTFGHRPLYLSAEDEAGLRGVLPLFALKTRFFGTMAVSMPFLNYGGLAADDEATQRALLDEARRVGAAHGCEYIEFRHRFALPGASNLPTTEFKVTNILDIAAGEEHVWTNQIHQNVRNKIRKAEKSDVRIAFGREHLDDFYRVFAVNQRNHATPVLPKRWFVNLLHAFGDAALVTVATYAGRPIGAKLTVDFRDTCYFIWSASVPAGNRFAPVPAMNWAAIRAAAARGLTKIDFGRSTKGGGGYNFKKYWGGIEEQLYWQYILLTREQMPGLNTTSPKFERAIRLWRQLPVWLTRLAGPMIARDLP